MCKITQNFLPLVCVCVYLYICVCVYVLGF